MDICFYLAQMALQVQAAESNCEIIVREIAFCDDLPEGVRLPEKPLPPLALIMSRSTGQHEKGRCSGGMEIIPCRRYL